MRVLQLLILICWPAATYALDADGRYMLHGAGAVSCGTFVQAENGTLFDAAGTRQDMLSWAQGYMSAYNHLTDDVYDIFDHTDTRGIELWLYNYCQSYPLQTFPEALERLLKRLYPNRITTAPR